MIGFLMEGQIGPYASFSIARTLFRDSQGRANARLRTGLEVTKKSVGWLIGMAQIVGVSTLRVLSGVACLTSRRGVPRCSAAGRLPLRTPASDRRRGGRPWRT